tara:strand:- start:315 stop:458 length:144 start_codon:yes stop_codon:yes gene_type:complete
MQGRFVDLASRKLLFVGTPGKEPRLGTSAVRTIAEMVGSERWLLKEL